MLSAKASDQVTFAKNDKWRDIRRESWHWLLTSYRIFSNRRGIQGEPCKKCEEPGNQNFSPSIEALNATVSTLYCGKFSVLKIIFLWGRIERRQIGRATPARADGQTVKKIKISWLMYLHTGTDARGCRHTGTIKEENVNVPAQLAWILTRGTPA